MFSATMVSSLHLLPSLSINSSPMASDSSARRRNLVLPTLFRRGINSQSGRARVVKTDNAESRLVHLSALLHRAGEGGLLKGPLHATRARSPHSLLLVTDSPSHFNILNPESNP